MVFIVSNEPIEPLSKVPVRIVGAFKCVDSGVTDDKLVDVLEGDDVYVNLVSIRQYLETYKDGFEVLEFVEFPEALELLEKSRI